MAAKTAAQELVTLRLRFTRTLEVLQGEIEEAARWRRRAAELERAASAAGPTTTTSVAAERLERELAAVRGQGGSECPPTRTEWRKDPCFDALRGCSWGGTLRERANGGRDGGAIVVRLLRPRPPLLAHGGAARDGGWAEVGVEV